MDLSHSMEAHKTTLAGLSDVLDKAMKNITSKYQLGFGSFVDKVLMPYVLTFPEKYVPDDFIIIIYFNLNNNFILNVG